MYLLVQGVGLSLYFFRYCLKPTIFAPNWHDWAHLEENIHPFVILGHFIRKFYKISKILNLQKYAIFSIARDSGLMISLKPFSISLKISNIISKIILNISDNIFLLDF